MIRSKGDSEKCYVTTESNLHLATSKDYSMSMLLYMTLYMYSVCTCKVLVDIKVIESVRTHQQRRILRTVVFKKFSHLKGYQLRLSYRMTTHKNRNHSKTILNSEPALLRFSCDHARWSRPSELTGPSTTFCDEYESIVEGKKRMSQLIL